MSEMNVSVADLVVGGVAHATAPANLGEQILALQGQLRGLRAEKARLEERATVIESELSRLFAEAALVKKSEGFLASLTAAERGALANKRPV